MRVMVAVVQTTTGFGFCFLCPSWFGSSFPCLLFKCCQIWNLYKLIFYSSFDFVEQVDLSYDDGTVLSTYAFICTTGLNTALLLQPWMPWSSQQFGWLLLLQSESLKQTPRNWLLMLVRITRLLTNLSLMICLIGLQVEFRHGQLPAFPSSSSENSFVPSVYVH